ncbi:MAG: hypothetical protein ABI779_10255 [Acidobacteriota bacterium]
MFVMLVVVVAFAGILHAAGVDKDNLKEYGTGIIKDYSDMKETDDIEWVWVRPGAHLADYRYVVKSFENLTAIDDDDMDDVFEKYLPKTLTRMGSKEAEAPLLHVESAVYWTQRASSAKRWIPYAGGHLAQAGVGVELVFTDDKGEIVCKIRHSGREGDELEDAAQELVDDVGQFVRGE